MKHESRNVYEKEPLMQTNVFVLAELPAGEPTTGSVEVLTRGLTSKFDQVTTIDTCAPDTWANLIALSQDAANYFLTYPAELVTIKPLVTVAFLHWNTTNDFIKNLIVYGSQINPLVEELLICDASSLLHGQRGKEIQRRFAEAGILQDCYDIFDNAPLGGLTDRIASKSLRQQRTRAQCHEIISRSEKLKAAK